MKATAAAAAQAAFSDIPTVRRKHYCIAEALAFRRRINLIYTVHAKWCACAHLPPCESYTCTLEHIRIHATHSKRVFCNIIIIIASMHSVSSMHALRCVCSFRLSVQMNRTRELARALSETMRPASQAATQAHNHKPSARARQGGREEPETT